MRSSSMLRFRPYASCLVATLVTVSCTSGLSEQEKNDLIQHLLGL